MILPIPPIRRRRRPRRFDPIPSPAPVVVRATVAYLGEQRFCWYFDTPYADPTGPWSGEDFAGLRVGGGTPVGIDEIVGVDGTLTLEYDLPDPTAPGLQYEVFSAPAVLHFDGGKTLEVPQNGVVTP